MAFKEIYDLGETIPLGEVPKKMHAFIVRQDRFGKPIDAWKSEVIDVPTIGPKDVLVYVMATGINYNNVWAALGYPVDVIATRQKKGEPETFHAGGSDASGIVWAPETRWAEEVVEEFAGFPNMEHDDLVDSSTQALLRFRQGGFVPLDSDEEDEPIEHNRKADYY